MNARLLLLSLLGFVRPCAAAVPPSAPTSAPPSAPQAVPLRAPASQAPGWPAPAADDVFLPGVPEVVCGAMPTNVSFSPDGRYIIAVRKWSPSPLSAFTGGEPNGPNTTTSVVIWSAATHRSTAVWSQDTPPTAPGKPTYQSEVTAPQWMRGSHYAFFLSGLTGDDGLTLWRADARRGAVTKVAVLAPGEDWTVSPTRPLAFILGADGQGAYLKPMTQAGAVGPLVRLGPARSKGVPLWSADGNTLYTIHVDPPPATTPEEANQTEAAEVRYAYAYDTRTGTTTRQAVPDRSRLYTPEEKQEALGGASGPSQRLKLAISDVTLSRSETKETAHAVWLEETIDGKVQRFLVTADGQAELSPARDAVSYRTREGLFVLPLLRIPHTVYIRAHETAVRSQVLSNVKQIALAAMMYSQDYDQNYPAAGSDIQKVLEPYARSKEIFSGPNGGFVYTFQGGAAGDIKNPATTVMGYMPVSGGYAVAYMDGHVQWRQTLPGSDEGQ